jgi:glyoxylase-like metal-dependent hydrolase (beta-lactamase superfamily II)
LFPGDQIYQPQQLAEALEKDTFTIEGHEFRVIQVGRTDTVDTTVLHVPDLSLVVAGDAVYGDVHQYFGEADTTKKRKEWLAALDTIESLKPHTVVAGHKRAGSVDGLYNVQATREYIEAFDHATRTCKSAEELYGKIQELYPNRINPHAILRGAAAAFPQSTKL